MASGLVVPGSKTLEAGGCLYIKDIHIMSKKDEIRHLWREAFRGDSEEYIAMYFDRIYRDGDALTAEDQDGKIVSALLMQPYKLWFHSNELPICYLAGAATRRGSRGHGLMSALIETALLNAREQGKMMCALIPAYDWLYSFFDRFGFSTVFLSDTQRFTSLHAFSGSGIYEIVENPYSDAVYQAFCAYERTRPGGVLHSHRDFLNILDELSLRRDGTFIAVGRKNCPVAAMVWAVGYGEVIQVNELLGIDEEARLAAMRALRERFPNRPVRYLAPVEDRGHRHLYSRGMTRIVNVEACLGVIAAANPEWKSTVRVTDPLIPENNHTWHIECGRCEVAEGSDRRPDFDVSVDVLCRIVFSSPEIGEILGFPTERTHISLMPH